MSTFKSEKKIKRDLLGNVVEESEHVEETISEEKIVDSINTLCEK